MSEQLTQPRVCRNGHQQPAFADKFCIYCGVSLEASSGPGTQTPVHPQTNLPAMNSQGQAHPQPQPGNQNYPQQYPNSPPQHYNQHNQYPPPPQGQYLQQRPGQVALQCYACGGNGQRLGEKIIICEECRWLKPLAPGYQIDTSAFAWAADGKAMAALRSMKTLNAAAKAVSDKVGRRWIESTFNGVLLGQKQLPQIYGQAVRAARILGMSHMPDVYLSGERPWDCLTFGSEKDSFIVIGSAMAGNFQGPDLLFLLAREMGHCRAGHALWKTVIRFFLGEQGPGEGMLAGGFLDALLNPTQLITSAVEVPLLAWARQAEITADRAGMITVGDEEVARRVLLSWSLKSSFIYRQINIEAWLEQQADDDEGYSRLSQLTTTSTPYIIPRLKLLGDFAKSRELQYWRNHISDSIKQDAARTPATSPSALPAPAIPATPPPDPKVIKLKCATCQTPMRVPLKVLAGKSELPVKCPNKKCGKITRLKKNVKAQENSPIAAKPKKNEEEMNYVD